MYKVRDRYKKNDFWNVLIFMTHVFSGYINNNNKRIHFGTTLTLTLVNHGIAFLLCKKKKTTNLFL